MPDEIHQITLKAAPVSADEIVIEDSVNSWNKKRIAISTLPAGSPAFGVPTGNIDIGDSAAEGSSGDSTRADHQHQFSAPGAGYPLDVAETEDDGTASTPARADHIHAHGSGYLASAHHTATVAGDLNLADLLEKDHASLTNKNAETDFKHLTDAQQGALHSIYTLEAHTLATSGVHTDSLPLTDLAAGSQGSIIKVGASDWEELGKGTNTYVLKAGATDIAWGQVDYSELAGTQPDPVAHVLATTGPHTDTLPLTDLATGSQGSIIRRGAADWEEYSLGTNTYFLMSTATDVEWTQLTQAHISDLVHTDTTAIHDNVDGEIVLITEKTVLVGADMLVIEDSEASNAKKMVQITNLPGGADADAVHVNIANEITGITLKGTPVAADELIIEDSENSYNKKSITIGTLPGGHTRLHAMTDILDHSAVNWKVFYSDGSAHVIELALGADNTFLKSNGASVAPTFEAYVEGANLTDLDDVTTASEAEGDILLRGASLWGNLAKGTDNYFLVSTATTINWEALDITLDPNLDATANEIDAVADPTGRAQGDVLYASATDTLTWLTKGSDNDIFRMNGNVPNWEAMPSFLLEILEDTSPQLGGDLDLNGNDISVAPSYAGDHTWEGMTVTITTDAGAFGEALYLKNNGAYAQADASAAATMPCSGIWVASGLVLLIGTIRDDTYDFTIGGYVYVSETTGGFTTTIPPTSGAKVQKVGIALSADSMYFNPGGFRTVEVA